MENTAGAILTIFSAAALVLATTGLASAQEAAPNPAGVQTQAKKGDGSGSVQGAQNRTGTAPRLGPADGTGRQGLAPQHRTGNGSAGRIGAAQGKDQAAPNGMGNRGPNESGQRNLTRTRSRNLNGSARGTCSGPVGRSGRASGGSRGGGRR